MKKLRKEKSLLAEKLRKDTRIQATLAFSQHDLIGGEFWAEFQGHAEKCKGIVLAFSAGVPCISIPQYTALFEDGDIISFSLEELRRYNICFSSEELAKKNIYAQANKQVKKHIFDLCQVHPDMVRLNASDDYYTLMQGWDIARMIVDTERLKNTSICGYAAISTTRLLATLSPTANTTPPSTHISIQALRGLFEPFGTLLAFNQVGGAGTFTTAATCIYYDSQSCHTCVSKLNGMQIGGFTLTTKLHPVEQQGKKTKKKTKKKTSRGGKGKRYYQRKKANLLPSKIDNIFLQKKKAKGPSYASVP